MGSCCEAYHCILAGIDAVAADVLDPDANLATPYAVIVTGVDMQS